MVLLPMCGVKNRRSRSVPVVERREMHVIAGLRADLGKQGAVHPVYDRSIHFTGAAKHLAVIAEFRHENVLHLQIASRMQQRHRIDETFKRARAEMEALVQYSFPNETLQQTGFHARRQRRIQNALDRDEAFFEADGVPDVSPEGDPLIEVGMMQMLRSDFEQPVNGAYELRRRDSTRLADARSSGARYVRASLHEIQLAVANDDLVRREDRKSTR